jgi:putative ABC transport system substrate-binding protein
MRRRRLLLAALLTPTGLTARRAFAAERVVGWISPESREAIAPFLVAFRSGIESHIRAGAQPIRIIERFADGDPARIAGQVAELQQLGVRLIVAQGIATLPVVRADPKVPVVFGYSGDPVVAGIVRSLAQPGVNATGMTFMSVEINPKRIDLVRDILPSCRHIALLSKANHAGEEKEIAACQAAVAPAGINLATYRVHRAAEAAAALERALDSGAEAVIALPSASMIQQTPTLAAGCLRRRVPFVGGWAEMARAGALLSYGANLPEAYRRVASYVIRILDGATAASLPIEQPTTFELVINLKAARQLDLNLPPSLLARADEVIE